MATDYDAPRKTDDDDAEDSIEELKSRRVDKSASSVDVDETEHADGFTVRVQTRLVIVYPVILAAPNKFGSLPSGSEFIS